MAEEEVNYEFSETPVVTSLPQQRKSPEDILGIAAEIWNKIKKSNIAATDDEKNDKLLAELQKTYSDFNISFPIVMRWMVQMRKYSSKAFEKYLLKHATTKLDSREEFLKLQAEYLTLLKLEESKHPDMAVIHKYKQNVIDMLLEEDKAFMDMHKQVEEEMEKKRVDDDSDRRKMLIEFIKKRTESEANFTQ